MSLWARTRGVGEDGRFCQATELTRKPHHFHTVSRVCIDYKDVDNLVDEATEARHLGYDGKQAIHPNQVDPIQRAFTPSEAGTLGGRAAGARARAKDAMASTRGPGRSAHADCDFASSFLPLADIERAARIKTAYERAVSHNNAGAVGFIEKGGGSTIMIDAPMLKQADAVLAKARAAGVSIPDVSADADAPPTSSSSSSPTPTPSPASRSVPSSASASPPPSPSSKSA